MAYRIQQAEETLGEAEILADKEAYRGACNRAYYAMFYAVVAVLATKGLGSSKHSGIISLFDREFVKTGVMSKEHSKRLHVAFENRQQHDYGEFMPVSPEHAKDAMSEAQTFVSQIVNHLKENNFL